MGRGLVEPSGVVAEQVVFPSSVRLAREVDLQLSAAGDLNAAQFTFYVHWFVLAKTNNSANVHSVRARNE